MNAPKQALLLVGSPKPRESTSESLGACLIAGLEKRGVKTQTLRVARAVRSEESVAGLRTAVAAADLVVLSFPLYIDCLPGPAVRALEIIAAERAGESGVRDKAFAAICQSGFPEVDHSTVALEVCRHFAEEAGFEWVGGLVLAAGGMIDGLSLVDPTGRMRMMRSAVRSLDLSAEDLAAGRPVSDEAVRLMAKLPIPALGYRMMANRGWRSQFKKRGEGESLEAMPFA